ncbi:hypothetical protein K432DRAFT_330055 [Lepidopterella palustris CBS 459.81]|uniref:UBX domain-containing protein 2 n=1 Tax=Lepidopterella palustris CBS 459.81 TaxID=1314670 RepID=A0A8E2E8R4_9PEZI|nr:hypothetical protein K432DRAFT_330055 [Lepidopterella palustris CBS 459.81]
MFHQGDLQSGIALAIQQAKLVACFVRDDGPESSTWEDEWLQSDQLSALLVQTAVLLRIEAGSTEAGFLSAFCPVTKVPTLVVIHNGQLREQLVGGVSQEEFILRLRTVLGVDDATTTGQTTTSTQGGVLTSASTETSELPESSIPAVPSNPASQPPTTSSTQMQTMLAERAKRLEADKKRKDEAEKAARAAKAKGKQKAVDEELDPAGTSSVKAQQLSAAAQARKRKIDDREELKRIQARIEADKQERKAKDEARRAALAEAAERRRIEQVELAQAKTHAANIKSAAKSSRDIYLNVRLFDGSTIKAYFPRTSTLQDVREWVDNEIISHAETPSQPPPPPYTFKQILAPLPSRSLSAGDEAAELGDIDLAPSATLVLVPVHGYTEAYSSNASGGVLGTLYGGVTGIVSGAIGLVTDGVSIVGGALRSVTGYGAEPAQQQGEGSGEGRAVGSNAGAGVESNIRVRTLADQRARDRDPVSEQFYNGNQLNFEPNEDSEDGK